MIAPRTRILVFIGAAVIVVVLVGCAIISPRAAAAGWLVGFVFGAQILIGSLSLVMIHRLTSGNWGEVIAPAVDAAAATVPLLILLVLPLFVAIPALYPWAQHPSFIKSDVLTLYLNRSAFILRSVVAIAGWSMLAFLLRQSDGGRGRLLAALGLVFHAVAISSVSIDWYLSIEAPFTSSSFGASAAICSLVAALAWAAVWSPVSDGDVAIGDVGALLLATVLGLTYIDFMAVLVIWYGDLPREEAWFVARQRFPWTLLAVAAFVLCSVVPILALIQSRFRNRLRPVRAVGFATLFGIAIYDAYLITPPVGALALGTSLLAVMAIGSTLIGVASLLPVGSPSLAEEPIDVR